MLFRFPALLVCTTALLGAGKHDPKIARAENDVVSITATPLADAESIKQALGTDLGNHYILMQIQLTPKAGKPLPVHVDDFLLRTDKDGEKTTPFVPSQMTGSAALVVSQVMVSANGSQNEQTGPVWGGMPGTGDRPRMMGGNGQMAGNSAAVTANNAKMKQADKGEKKEDPLRATLTQKMLPENEAGQPVSGLLYFPMEKQRVKDLELVYTTPAGKLNLRFK